MWKLVVNTENYAYQVVVDTAELHAISTELERVMANSNSGRELISIFGQADLGDTRELKVVILGAEIEGYEIRQLTAEATSVQE